MRHRSHTSLAAIGLGIGSAAVIAEGAFVDPDLSGTTSFDLWDDLTDTNPQVSTRPPCPGGYCAPITSRLSGSSDSGTGGGHAGTATLDRLSGDGDFSEDGLFSPSQSTFVITEEAPVANVETIILQIEIGSGPDGWLSGNPTLTVNGQIQIDLFASGISDSFATPGIGFGPSTVNTFVYQWDLQNVGPIESFEIAFTTDGANTLITGVQLDQGSEFRAVDVPAPHLVSVMCTAILVAPRRRRA